MREFALKGGGATYVFRCTIHCTNKPINTGTWRVQKNRKFSIFYANAPVKQQIRSDGWQFLVFLLVGKIDCVFCLGEMTLL